MCAIALAFAVLVATATAQTTPDPSMQEWYPFMNPGEILPGGALTVPYILDIVGGFWTKYRLIDSYAYLCSDVLPELSQKIPEIEDMSDILEPVCEEVNSSRNSENDFNATAFCDALVSLASDIVPAQPNMTSGTDPEMMLATPGMEMPPGDNMTMFGPGGLYLDLSMLSPLLDVVANVTMDLYHIDINDPSTICPEAYNFLEPSLPKLIYDFATELLSTLLPTAVQTCENWDGVLEGLGINSTSPLYPIVQEVEGLVSKAMGYESREDLCENITYALNHQTTSNLIKKVVNNLFHILTDEVTCGIMASDVINTINDVIMIMTPADNSTDTPFTITNDVIYQYTGFRNDEYACEAIDKAFSGCHSTGFDRDACNICVKSPSDGVPTFLSSNGKDCDEKCPLDMDHGAVMNNCSFCVLGGTGLPINEGLNECDDCGEDTTCVGCDGEPNSGKVFDNCDVCDGNHTDCMIVVTIEPSAIPDNIDYSVMVHGAGFHSDPTPICIFSRMSDLMEFNVTMDVVSPSMGYCTANLESAIYSVHVMFNTTRVIHSDNLEVYTPVTIDGVSEDVFTINSTPHYILRFTAAAESDFIQAQELGLIPYLIYLDDDEERPPVVGTIEGETTLTFNLQAPTESSQVTVSPSFNLKDLLPTTNGEPFTITFYDPPPQLDMATLTFKSTGNVLILEFPTEVSIMNDVLSDCNRIFISTVQDGGQERNLLGVGSQCSLSRNRQMLVVMLGRGDTLIKPGENITVRGDVIYGSGEYPSAAKETNITVSPGNSPTVVVILRGATSISSCGNVSLSARESTGSASRSFTYTWMVNPEDSTNLTDAVRETTTSDLNIDGNLLVEDVVYSFTVMAGNFLGGVGGRSIDVVRTPDMVPDLSITPSPVDPSRVMLSESFYLHAQVTFYSDCEGAEPKETEYMWTVNNDDVMLDETTKNSKSLYVPAFSLPGDTSITFTVEINGVNGSSGPSSDVTIMTHFSDPVAVIVGGRERNIGIGSGIVELDGSGSRDPDQPGMGDLDFTWKCVQIPENMLCVSAKDGSFFPAPEQLESTSVAFNASHMAAGKTYELSLKVSSRYRESPETSVFIYAMPGNSPQVLVSSPATRPVLSTKPFALTANVQHSTPVEIKWSIIGVNAAMDEIDFTGSATNTALDGSTWSVVHIQPGVLQPGETYIILVLASDELDRSGSSQMELVVASGVSSCQVNLENGNTYTELDEITFAIDNCVTDEGAYPLTYQLLASDDEGNERSLTPAGVESRIDIIGPPAMEGIGNRTFVARVCNSHGSCSSFSILASVEMRTTVDSEVLKNAIVSQETFKGDYLKAFTNLNALNYVEDRLVPEVRRRRRSAETSDRAADQLVLLHGATTTAVLDTSAASTLIDACDAIAVNDLSPEDTDHFLEMLHALVTVFACDQEIPTYSSSVVLEIINQIETVTDDEGTIEMCRELTMSLTKARLAGLLLGDTPAETSSGALTSSVFYAIPQGFFPSKSGQSAFYVDLGGDVAEMYGGYWSCGRGLCTGVHIQFDHYSDDIDPYFTDDKDRDDDRDNRASAILDIKLLDPSTCEELMVDSLSDPILINMTVNAKKTNHDLKCHVWDDEDMGWSSNGIGTMKIDNNMVQCKLPSTGSCVILAEDTGSSNAVIIIVSIIGALLALTLIVAIVIVIRKKTMKDKGDGNVATNDRGSAVATSMTSDAKQTDGSQEASTEYAYDFNMQNMASKVNC